MARGGLSPPPIHAGHILQRVAQSFLMQMIVGLVAFGMSSFVGSPIDDMLGQDRPQVDIRRLREQLCLDQSFFVQY